MINQPPSLLVLTPDWAAHYREWKHTGRRHINPGLQQNVTIILWQRYFNAQQCRFLYNRQTYRVNVTSKTQHCRHKNEWLSVIE